MRISKTFQSSIFKDEKHKEPPIIRPPKEAPLPVTLQVKIAAPNADLHSVCPNCANCLLHKFKSAREANNRAAAVNTDQIRVKEAQKEIRIEREKSLMRQEREAAATIENKAFVERKRAQSVRERLNKDVDRKKMDDAASYYFAEKKEQAKESEIKRIEFKKNLSEQLEERQASVQKKIKEEAETCYQSTLQIGNYVPLNVNVYKHELESQVFQKREQNKAQVK